MLAPEGACNAVTDARCRTVWGKLKELSQLLSQSLSTRGKGFIAYVHSALLHAGLQRRNTCPTLNET